METAKRFYTIMAFCWGLLTLLSIWRVLSADGGRIWYVPLLLAVVTALMALRAVQTGRKLREMRSRKED